MSRLIAQKICCWIFHRPRLDTEYMTGSEAYKDSFRKPRELLAFAGLEPHHKVLDVCTGFGYLAKHASEITIDEVDAQNGSEWIPFFESVGIHSAVKEMKAAGVRHYFAPLSDPAQSRTRQYDLITMQNSYHDLYDMPTSRKAFLHSLHRALKDDGKFLLIDHCAAPGRGARDAGANRGLHRIEECVVRAEIEACGFCVAQSSDMLRFNEDNYRHSAWTSPMRETDRFVLLCEKAQAGVVVI